jgi:hypothetical protein
MVMRCVGALFALLLAASPVSAVPITYDFTGTLTAPVNGSDEIAGFFILDGTSVTDYEFSTPYGTLAGGTTLVEEFVATNPASTFVGLSFFAGQVGLRLFFPTTLSQFVDGPLHTEGIAVFDLGAQSGLTALSPFSFNNFASGEVSVRDDVSPVPEPASLTLLGLGLAGMAGRRWRQRKTS